MIHTLYPQDRLVSEEKIISWYQDAVANGEADAGYIDIWDMALELDNIGHITLARQTAWINAATCE